MKQYAIAIVGPTASGKSAFALALAERLGGEIVSCDSMQIYRRMDIGTAKPTPEEQRTVRHHLIDIRNPNEPYSAGDYATDAEHAVTDILSRNRVPIFCGGTGLYLEAAVTGRHSETPPADPVLRDALLKEGETEEGRLKLFEELRASDPDSAEATHPNNLRRVVRALEIYRLTGKTKTEYDRLSRDKEKQMDTLTFCIDYADRSVLYDRIDRRVDKMMEAGLAEEAEELWRDGLLKPDTTAGQAIGYRQFLPVFEGEGTLTMAAEEIKQASRRYAKRQLTWFRAKDYITLDGAEGVSGMMQKAIPEIERFLDLKADNK